ncbi:MAG: SIS domain-containing protein [Calditrichota bacterium]
MTNTNNQPVLADYEVVKATAAKLREIDTGNMLDCALEFPKQIKSAIKASESYIEGDIPLDRTLAHYLGLGGSAIAGELLRDMVYPKRVVSIHRGTTPPRDKCGIVVSSYSGNTQEIVELAPMVTGGIKSVLFLTSGGRLADMAFEWAIPMWKIPTGYQPRAALGWSLGLFSVIMDRWQITIGVTEKLARAASRLATSLTREEDPLDHPIIRAAYPIASSLVGKNGLIFHSLSCTGAARRLAAQINENGKQPAFAVLMPEGLHNAIEGISGGDPEAWTIIYIYDPGDATILRDALRRSLTLLEERGFTCRLFPAAGNDQFELTLSRVLMGDFASLFLAALRGVDPTDIPTITALKPDIVRPPEETKEIIEGVEPVGAPADLSSTNAGLQPSL